MFHVDPAQLASRPAPAEAPSAVRALVDGQLAMLSELAEIGMEIARAAGRAATTAAPADDDAAADAFRGDPGLAYTRAARAVRLTIALQSKLVADLAALDKSEAKDAYERKSRRRQGLQRLIGEALEAERPEAAAWEVRELATFTRERLFDADEAADLLGRPFAELVARICDDLGLSPERAAQVVAGIAPPSQPAVIPDGPPGPIRDPGAKVAPHPVGPGAPPEDDGRGAGVAAAFLEWPPPAADLAPPPPRAGAGAAAPDG